MNAPLNRPALAGRLAITAGVLGIGTVLFIICFANFVAVDLRDLLLNWGGLGGMVFLSLSLCFLGAFMLHRSRKSVTRV